MSHAIAQCTRVAARRTAHASRAPRPAYPAPCRRSRESAANAKLPCLPFCDTEQRRPGSTHSPTSASSLSAIHQPELRLPPIIAISRGVHQFAAFPSASSCASIAKLVPQTPRTPSFYSLCPCAPRARKSSVSGHGTAFWHGLDPFRCHIYLAEFADLGFFCRTCFVATGEERNPCQNAVPWPEIDKIHARAQRTTKLEAFPSPTFLRILLPAPQQRGTARSAIAQHQP